MLFNVVVFVTENESALVPDNWVQGSNCYWPPYKGSQRINSAVQKREVPGPNWNKFPIRILFTGSWEEARSKLKMSEDTSDLQSGTEDGIEAKRATRKPERYHSDTADDTDEETVGLPQPPAKKRALFSFRPSPRKQVFPGQVNRQIPSPQPPPRIPVASPSSSERHTARLAEARDVRLFTLLEKLIEEQADVKRLVRQILARNVQEEVAESRLPEGCVLPLKTVEDMTKFEEELRNPQSFSAVVRYLGEYCGQSVKDSVFRILTEVILNDLARLYNFRGHKQKLEFGKLQLSTVVYKCLQRNPATRSCSRREVEDSIAKWLAGARDREGGRMNRTKHREPAAAAIDNQSD